MVRNVGGFTLIESMVVMLLIGLLAVVGAPYTISWFHEADVQKAANILQSAYGRGKSIALRNPHAVIGEDVPSAGLAHAGNVVLVCRGNPTAAGCAAGGANVEWQADLPAGVALTINGGAMTTHSFNNTGQSIDGSGSITTLFYNLSKGSRTYDGALR